jgi:two-component system LytT family response regulator
VTPLSVLVAEDEPLARAMVVRLLRQDPELGAIVECADASAVKQAVAERSFDIAFLDIQMPDGSGVALAASGLAGRPVVVFVTAFSRHAVHAFDVSAVDYVLKPFSDERFFAALERAKVRVRERRLGELASELVSTGVRAPDASPSHEYLERLACRDGDRLVVIQIGDVVWIQAEDYYVLVHSKRGRHMIRAALSSLEQRLDPKRFLRVHRTAIVNASEVVELRDEDRLVAVLSDGAHVPVSRSRRREVESVLTPALRRQ